MLVSSREEIKKRKPSGEREGKEAFTRKRLPQGKFFITLLAFENLLSVSC